MSEFKEKCPAAYTNFSEFRTCLFGKIRAEWYKSHPNNRQEDEETAPGCPYGMITSSANGYCFWKYIHNQLSRSFSEDEVAKAMNISPKQVKEITLKALSKLKSHEFYETLKELKAQGELYDPEEIDDDIYFPTGFSCTDDNHSDNSEEETPKQGFISKKSLVPTPHL